MKKYLGIFIAAILYFGMTCNIATALDASDLKINGEVNTLIKMQDSYFTPLDGAGEREGANWRNDQMFRAIGKLTFSYGDLGSSEWFAAAEIKFDANDPDATGIGAPNASNLTEIVELEHLFAMYRPFEMKGGRPFGIMAGIIPFKATAPAAYFHQFQGDFEEDYIFYTASALTEVPGIGLDFHISADTGLGIGYAKGAKDASKIITLIDGDSADTLVIWGEAKKWNIGWHGAMQKVSGEAAPSKDNTTSAGNTYMEYDKKYKHTVMNTGLTYTYAIGGVKIMPTIMYGRIDGEEVAGALSDLAWPNEPRDVNATLINAGIKVFTNFLNMPGEFAVLYTDIETDEFGGINVLPKGTIDSTIEIMAVPGWIGSGFEAALPEQCTKTAMALAGLDTTLQVEYSMNVTKNVKLGIFYNSEKSQADESIKKENILSQLSGTQQGLVQLLTAVSDPAPAATAAFIVDNVAGGVATNLEALAANTEWTDTNSFGLFCNISF